MKFNGLKMIYCIFLITLLVVCVALIVCYYCLPDEKTASLLGNIASGVVASIILLLFSGWKARKIATLNSEYDDLIKFMNEVKLCYKEGEQSLNSIEKDGSAESISEIIRNYALRTQQIPQFKFHHKKLYSHLVKDDDVLVEKIKNLCQYVVHVSFDISKISEIKNAIFSLQKEMLNIKFNAADVIVNNQADTEYLKNTIL